MTAFVFVVFLLAGIAKFVLPHAPLMQVQIRIERTIRSPLFFIPYDLGSLLVISFVIAFKPRAEYLYLRAILYGMLLAGLLGGFIVLFLPWKG